MRLCKLVAPLADPPPTHISIGFPGVVRNNHVLTAPHFGNENWHDIPLADMIAKRLGNPPVRMINDAEMQGLRRDRRPRHRVRPDARHGRGHGAFP